jgi:hypothetical protein
VSGVLLDIGGDVGAAVVLLDGGFPDDELEAQPVGRPEARFHTGVHLRPVDGTPVATAVFPAMRAGTYEVLDHAGRPFAAIEVRGGEVSTVRASA